MNSGVRQKEIKPMTLDIRQLFDSCALLEEKVAHLYYLFAELYSDLPELARLWRKTAEEEENHMRQFELAARLARTTALTPLVEPAAVGHAITMVTMITDKIRQTPPGWRDALKLAIDLEEKLSRLHVDTAVAYNDDTINKLFRSMMTNDEQHVQSLRRYLESSETPAG
jgi:rubrerythrin